MISKDGEWHVVELRGYTYDVILFPVGVPDADGRPLAGKALCRERTEGRFLERIITLKLKIEESQGGDVIEAPARRVAVEYANRRNGTAHLWPDGDAKPLTRMQAIEL